MSATRALQPKQSRTLLRRLDSGKSSSQTGRAANQWRVYPHHSLTAISSWVLLFLQSIRPSSKSQQNANRVVVWPVAPRPLQSFLGRQHLRDSQYG